MLFCKHNITRCLHVYTIEKWNKKELKTANNTMFSNFSIIKYPLSDYICFCANKKTIRLLPSRVSNKRLVK